MAKHQWSDFGGMWRTVREVDINAIRHEAERGLAIAVVGQPASLSWTDRLLRDGPNRYPASSDPLALVPLADVGSRLDLFGGVTLLILAFDAASPLDDAELAGLERLSATPRPSQVVLLFGETPGPSTPWSAYLDRRAAILVDPADQAAAALVADAVLDALPAEVHLAAARRLPGLRPRFAARLTGEVSASNAAVALASGVPSLVPLLGIPLAAADTIILTKNQALMVYRLALASGAPPEFQKRMLEITPVVGGAVMWRQIAAALVGLVPGYGILPKTAVAYGGTYLVGLVATRWYDTGLLTEAERKRFTAEAASVARRAAEIMVEQARAAGGNAGARARGGAEWASRGATAARARAGKAVHGCAHGHRRGDGQGRSSGAAHRAAPARGQPEGGAAPAPRRGGPRRGARLRGESAGLSLREGGRLRPAAHRSRFRRDPLEGCRNRLRPAPRRPQARRRARAGWLRRAVAPRGQPCAASAVVISEPTSACDGTLPLSTTLPSMANAGVDMTP